MIRHYLKVAFRNIFRHKFFSAINILSLSVGLSCFFLFLIYSTNETTYDKFNKNADSIFRVYEWSRDQNGGAYSGDAWLYLPLGPALKNDIPDVKDYVRLMPGSEPSYVKYIEKQVKLPITFADPSVFQFFSISMLYGNPATALSNGNNVVLTRKNSRVLFGDEDPVGRILSIKIGEHFDNFKVSGVTEDLPSNTSVSFDLLLNMAYFESTPGGKMASTSWNYSGFENFIWLHKNSTLPQQTGKLVSFRKKYFPDEETQQLKDGSWDGKGLPPVTFRLQPLMDIHNNSRITAGSENHPIDMNAIWILFGIATGILIIGCVNFTTLAIARSSNRSREIGIRKFIGGQKRQIMTQFLGESFLISCIAGAAALFLAWLFMPVFDTMINADIHFSIVHYPNLIWLFAIVVTIIGLLSGIYPAAILANLNIVAILKNRLRINGTNIFTKALITAQYILSIGLVIATIVIAQQLHYMRTMDIGFNKDNVILINASETDGTKTFPLFTTALRSDHDILGITSSDGSFGDKFNSSGFKYNGKVHPVFNFAVATNFPSVMGMHLIAGRMLDAHIPNDTINSVIVNEALVRDIGLTNESILGMKLQNYSAKPAEDPIVVGVVRDYNLQPARQKITPILFREKNTYKAAVFYVHVKPENPKRILKTLRSAWQKAAGDAIFDYSFLDEILNAQYQQESRLSTIISYASVICIFLASLGLGSLAYLSSENRTKELVIRKIFGGSLSDIIYLLSKDFLRIIILSVVIATPLSWYFLHGWLEGYAFRIRISLWVYIITCLGALIFTFMILSATLIKVALRAPVKNLKVE